MVNWMLAQVDDLKKFLKERAYTVSEDDFSMLNVLASDPTTPPAGADKFSSVTLISFKSWDARKAFVDHYGGSGGSPLYLSETQSVQGSHIRASPASPQFQRKLEIPLRVVLQTTPPDWLMTDEATLWNYAWNHVVFGIQHELVAEKQLFKDAFQVAKGNGKGTCVGKGACHWTAPPVCCSNHSPYPLELSVARVDQVAYVWGEYCHKFGESSKKCGDYKMATYKGRPSGPAASVTPP